MTFAQRARVGVVTCFVALGAVRAPSQVPVAIRESRPNIIFILADDFSTNLLQYMPNVQAMQREGATFANYFVAASLCCPSRSSIFTGKYPHNTGVLTNAPPDGGYGTFNRRGNDSHTFSLALQKAGYRTAMLGKYLNGYLPRQNGVAPGWNTWAVAGNGYPEFNYFLNESGRVHHYGTEPEAYLTDVVAGMADRFIRASSSDPFFIEVATFAPHAPYIPAPRDRDSFPGLTAPRTPMFAARPDATAPAWLREIPVLQPVEISRIDAAFRMRAQSVQAIDKMIGQLRATLAALGIDKKTYLVFSSDNGLHMGEYSLRPGKMTPYDIDMHVPLIVIGPGIPAGATIGQIAQNVDLAPTFSELVGEPGPLAPDGHSLVSLLRTPTTAAAMPPDWRHVALIEHHHPTPDPTDPDTPAPFSANPPSYEALRGESFLYVEYDHGDRSYYDLTRDPMELRNIVKTVPPARLQQLHDMLHAVVACQGTRACWNAQRAGP
jgi:arylsulfatase A-like enzyme